MNRAAIYIRVSSRMQADEGFSMEAQHDILMELVNKKGLQLYRVYSDPAVSGKTFKRPGVQAMVDDMKAGRFDTVVIHKLDRLSRNQGDLYNFLQLINKLDVRLIIAAQGSEEIDTRSPMGKAFLMFSGIWAEVYLDNLREETLKGLIKKAQKGGRYGSRPLLGYTFNDDMELVIKEDEAELVREVYRLFLAGWGKMKIARHMNEKSKGKEGGLWDADKIDKVVTNPRYAGYNHFKPKTWSEDRRIITEGTHQPIVSKEDFEAAKKIVKRRFNSEMSRNSYLYAYSGIIKCGLCGANFNGTATTVNRSYGIAKYKNYVCHKNIHHKLCTAPKISEKNLNELILSQVIFEGGAIQPKVSKKRPKVDIQKEVETSNRRKKNWMLALGDGNLTSKDYAALIEDEEVRMAGVFALIAPLEVEEKEFSPEELLQLVTDLKNNWELISEEMQKEMVQSMFKSITIHHDGHRWIIDELKTV
ncbi:recombinase family protein [Paenibacillus harenae]|uniref:recombinase family protein n=1 Tax=Paenibacillus harenae TaxID=306543 RepID=UPI00278F51A0|nr:recombinase family protein [Paenibacillus harenae]MDQ0062323.1 site-specific DNA recombinase [Paenibacillus harenae]